MTSLLTLDAFPYDHPDALHMQTSSDIMAFAQSVLIRENDASKSCAFTRALTNSAIAVSLGTSLASMAETAEARITSLQTMLPSFAQSDVAVEWILRATVRAESTWNIPCPALPSLLKHCGSVYASVKEATTLLHDATAFNSCMQTKEIYRAIARSKCMDLFIDEASMQSPDKHHATVSMHASSRST